MSTSTRRHPPQRQRRGRSPSPGTHGPNSHGDRAGSDGVIHTTQQRTSPGPASRRATNLRAMSRFERFERQRQLRLLLKVGGWVLAGVAVLALVYFASTPGASSVKTGKPGQFRFAVASPSAGAVAPAFTLPSTAGGTANLSDYRGKNVLLYFQEGIGCEGCWTQMKDIQTDMKDFQMLGIETMLTITTNPLDALKQKVADEGLTLPVLSDESFAVSRAYNATAYGMMAGSADGHTFILVGPDGRIRWRADYGGPPDYTMYVPVSNLIADIKAGTTSGS